MGKPNADPQAQGVQALVGSAFQTLAASTGAGTKLLLVPDTGSDQTYLDARSARWDLSQNLLFPKASHEAMLVRVTLEYKIPALLPATSCTIAFRNLSSQRLIGPFTFSPISTVAKVVDIDGILSGSAVMSFVTTIRPVTAGSLTKGLQIEAMANNAIQIRLTNINIIVL